MKKVLILGGFGFIGLNIAKELLNKGNCHVTIADVARARNLNNYFETVDEERLKIIIADFSDFHSFNFLETSYDCVYMLASIVGVNNTLLNPSDVIFKNTALILNTLNWLKQADVSKVLFSSTSEVYAGAIDQLQWRVPTNEQVPVTISDISSARMTYAATKALGESAFLNCASDGGYAAVVLRFHNVFGPDMGFKHVIPHLVERFHYGESPFQVYGANQTRAFCYIKDAARASILAAESEQSNGQIFHIGSTEEVSMRVLTETVGSYFNYKGEFVDAETYPGSVERRCPDITKAEKFLDYRPEVKWIDGLAITVDWYRNYFKEHGNTMGAGFVRPKDL